MFSLFPKKKNTLDDKLNNLETKINDKIGEIEHKVDDRFEKVNERIIASSGKIDDLDKKIIQVQKSTRTLFKIFSGPHNWLRSKSKIYYNWHLNPAADNVHWVTAIVAFLVAVLLVSWQLGFLGGEKPASFAAQGVPKMVNYQGKLTDFSNLPVADGSYNFIISIYDQETGGSCLWTWKGSCATPVAVPVTVSSGIFSALLGESSYQSTNALGLDFNTDSYFLDVSVAGEKLLPRKRIGAVGYAYNSDTVDGKHETDFVLLNGRTGGQKIDGGVNINENLTIEGTSNSNKTGSNVILQPDGGYTGIGLVDPNYTLSVKNDMEIRRTGSVSQLLFTNTNGTGDFRIAGDGNDLYWQGGGGRSLQLGSYWATILMGDTQSTTFPPFQPGLTNMSVMVTSSRTVSVSLVVRGTSSQTADLQQWQNASGTVLAGVNTNGGIYSDATDNALILGGNNANISFTGTGLSQIITAANQDIAIMPGGTLGSVGINITTPEGRFHVNGISVNTSSKGVYSNVNVKNNTTNPNYQIDLTADSLTLWDYTNDWSREWRNVSEVASLQSSGANGLDTGTEAANTWYYLWIIGKADSTIDSLISLSSTSPTMPSGYTYRMRIGSVYNDGSSNIRQFSYDKGFFQWKTTLLLLTSGNATSPTAINLGIAVPVTSETVRVNSYGTAANTTVREIYINGNNLSNGQNSHFWGRASSSVSWNSQGDIIMDTLQTIYYYVNNNNGRLNLSVLGYYDIPVVK